MSPLAVSMLMHFRARPEPFPDQSAPSQREIINWFISDKIIELVNDVDCKDPYFKTTERGDAWVEMICDTPMPEQRWIDPRFKESDHG